MSLAHLNPRAAKETQTRIEEYATDLLAEAGRLEATARTTGGDPEITSSMIADANLLLRRGYRHRPRNRWFIFGKIVSPAAALFAGLLADIDKLKEPTTLTIFILLVVAALTATVLSIVLE